jgi:hypothetical protein
MTSTTNAGWLAAAIGRPFRPAPPCNLTFRQARRLSTALLVRRVIAWPWEVRGWTIGTIRDAVLWCRTVDRRPAGALEVQPFEEFIASRATLRRCRRCGCTDDNGCQHPGIGPRCWWAERDLCSECRGKPPIAGEAAQDVARILAITPPPDADQSFPCCFW